ncbi:MAG: cadherin-like beta sandwich domain-containing protein [Bacilli bacterium]|nr:cadherin-like beta sandwich domain-containing protein [Bacilli bacterium]
MKKRLIKSLFISLGVVACGCIPNVANAADFSFGKKEQNDNVTKLPVIMNVGEGESITEAKFGCEVDNTEVDCVIEKNEGSAFFPTESRIWTFTYVGSDGQLTTEGQYTLAYVVLTNNSTARITNLQVSLLSASINGESKSKSIKTEVAPKKIEVKSDDATLKNLKISQGTISPAFNRDVKEYTVYGIADTINSIRLTPECNEGSCSFDISGGKSVDARKSQVTLNQGENTVKIEVDSEDGNNKETYTLTIYRGETTFNSAKLASITTGEYTLTPAFSSDVKEYTLTVPNTTSNLVNILEYKAMDENAKVNVTGIDNFVEGANKLTITVDNVNGDETVTYTINVTRLSAENIEILKYIDDKVTFKDSEGIQTTLDIDIFKVTYPNEYNKIINNEYQFDTTTGDIIINTPSTSDDQDDKNEEKKPSSKTWLIVGLVVVGLIIIGVSGYFIFRKKKPEDDKELGDSLLKEEEEVQIIKDEEELVEEEIDETGIEEEVIESEEKDPDKTVDVDEALEDLMNTKQYDFNFVDDDE